MPFGVVSGVGLGMGVLDFGGDRRRGEFAASHGNQWDFVASLCGNVYSDRAVVWRGEWGGPRHSCVTWKSTCIKGKELLFLAWFLALLRRFRPILYNGTYGYTDIQIDNRLVCEKLAVLPYGRYTVEFCVKFPFF